MRGPAPAILMYHRVAEESFDPWGLAVAPARFAAHMEWLSRKRAVLPLTEFARRHRSNSLPGDAVALTFDDGYECVAEVAMPILERLGIPATIFIPPALIERGGEFWWDELQRMVVDFAGSRLRVDGEAFELGGRQDSDRHWRPGSPPSTPRQQAFLRLWSLLRDKNPHEQDRAMDALRAQASDSGAARESHRPMAPDVVRSISSKTIHFGSHALTHPSLPKLESPEKTRQIGESIQKCAALSGVVPAAFAYPYGDLDPESEGLVERAGFICACTTQAMPVTRRSRPYAMPRLQAGDWDVGQLERALAEL